MSCTLAKIRAKLSEQALRQPLATLSRPLYAHKMSFCARRLTRHPNQSQALYGVSGKAQPLALLGSSLGSGDSDCDCDSGAGRAASLAARHHYLCAANITNNMKKTQQQFPRTDRRLKAGKGRKGEGGGWTASRAELGRQLPNRSCK